MAKKIKTVGRPLGAPNNKSEFVRDCEMKFRCSYGFNKCVEELVSKGIYKSKADAIHEAIQQLAYKKLPADFYWLNKIQ